MIMSTSKTYLSHLMALFSKLVSAENYMENMCICIIRQVKCKPKSEYVCHYTDSEVYSGHSDLEILAN